MTDSVSTSLSNRRRTILDVIRNARRDLHLSMFRCNDGEILWEIQQAAARGVRVHVLATARSRGGAHKRKKLWETLRGAGASLHVYADPVVKYHAKYLVADDGPAVVASFNFTRKCFERTCDACVLTYDPRVVSGLKALIAADLAAQPLPSDLTPRLIVGPERSRWQLTALIDNAKSSIRVVDAKLSDPDFVRLLRARRADGLRVQVFSAKRIGKLKSHGKILLIDDRVAVVGSLALASVSLDLRREVALVVEAPGAVAVVARLFRVIERAGGRQAEFMTDALSQRLGERSRVRGFRQGVLC